MLCPTCGDKLETRDTRRRADGTVKRRKVCACGFRGTTVELFASTRVLESEPGGTLDRDLDQTFDAPLVPAPPAAAVQPVFHEMNWCACEACARLRVAETEAGDFGFEW